jgi:fucose permease
MCRPLQLGIFLLAVGLLYALPRHANAELLPHFALFYMLVAGFSIAGTAVTSLVSTLSKDNVGALIGVTQGVGEVAGTLSPIISASLFAINSGSSSSSSGGALVSFGDSIGQGALPNVITAGLLLLLLVVTPVPLRIIQGRLDDEHVKDDTAATAPPPTAQTRPDAAHAPASA